MTQLTITTFTATPRASTADDATGFLACNSEISEKDEEVKSCSPAVMSPPGGTAVTVAAAH